MQADSACEQHSQKKQDDTDDRRDLVNNQANYDQHEVDDHEGQAECDVSPRRLEHDAIGFLEDQSMRPNARSAPFERRPLGG